jgi:hypothetical protein
LAGTPRLYSSPSDFLAGFDLRTGWVLWIGAGTSLPLPAGLPTVGPVIDVLLKRLGAAGSGSSSTDRLAARVAEWFRESGRYDLVSGAPGGPSFEAVMGEVAGHTGGLVGDYLRRLYPSKARSQPNSNHRVIVELAQAGDCSLVVTTNFDQCIEAAGFPADRVLVPGPRGFETCPGTLLKVHGTSSRPASMAATPAGLSSRANSPAWSRSLLEAIRGRDVLCFGYSLRDWFDINPVLQKAVASAGTRLVVFGPKLEKYADGPQLAAFTRDDDYVALQVMAGKSPLRLAVPSRLDQDAAAQRALREAEAKFGLSPAMALQALAGLLHRVEDGENSLHLYALAAQTPGTTVDDALMAAALLRARRYRAAERRLARVLAGPLPVWERIRLESGAGYLAQAGGRPDDAERHFSRAERLFEDEGRDLRPWPRAAADEFLRGRAERLVRRAMGRWNERERHRDLDRAEVYYDMLCRYERSRGFLISVHLLVPMLKARIALGREDRAMARSILEAIAPDVIRWADPHLLIVHQRLLAAAAPERARRLVLPAVAESVRRGRWQEAGKAMGNLLGFYGYGRSAPIQMAVRNAFVRAWDSTKDASTFVYHRWAR